MRSISPAHNDEGLTLRQAALIAGFGYLLMPVAYAEFSLYPKVVIAGNIEQTSQNIVAHGRLFGLVILCHLITSILDVVIAWALYVLFVPVNRSLSLLTAWFRLMFTALALFSLLNLVTVFRLLNTPDYLASFGITQLHAQAKLLLNSFRYDWSMSLVIFGIHLGLLGYLIYRSGYIPKIIGILLIVEDNDEDYYTVARVLGKFGSFPLRRCSKGTEVMERLTDKETAIQPSLIFLDLDLPGKKDGRSVLAQLKADARFRRIPVVIITTSASPSDVRNCFDHGAAGYMVKPVNLDKFVESIEGVVKYWFEIMTLPAKVEGAK